MSVDHGRYGYGSGLSLYTLQQLWDIVEPQDHGNGYTHPDAWRHMGELCTAMAQKLRETGAAIADRWPPERSRAAAAFRARLELLAKAFDDAGQVGTANAPHLFDLQITNASFRGAISSIVDQYNADSARVDARIKAYADYYGADSDWRNAPQDQKLAATNVPGIKEHIDTLAAPMSSDWKSPHEFRAKAAAAAYETELASYKGTFAQPKPIDPTLSPPDTPRPPGSGGGGGSPIGVGLRVPPPLMPTQSPIDPGSMSDYPTGGSEDPVLDQLPGGPLPGGPMPGGGPGGYDLPGAGAPLPGGATVPWIPTAGGGYAMAPGGVIGEPIRTPLGAGSAAAAAIARAAGPAFGAGAAGRAATGSGFVAPPGGMIGGQRGGPGAGRGNGGGRRRPDDDQSFTVPEGVPAVLVPPPDSDEHAPGPGVIGIDR